MASDQHELEPHTEIWLTFQKLWVSSFLAILFTLALMWIFLG